jgi:DNA-binding transcriptional LysR family regulator
LADSIRSAASIAVELRNNDPTIRSFREAFPLVSLTLEEFLSNELIERLRNEQMDGAIVRRCLVDPEGLVITPLLEEPMVVALPEVHRRRQRSTFPAAFKADQALSQFVAEESSNEAQELHRAVGFGHVVIAACRARLFLITLHRKRAHCNDRYRLESGFDLYSPGGLVTVDYRHLDILEDEVGAIGFGLGDSGIAISGLDDCVT